MCKGGERGDRERCYGCRDAVGYHISEDGAYENENPGPQEVVNIAISDLVAVLMED